MTTFILNFRCRTLEEWEKDNTEKVCDFFDEMQAFEDMDGYLLQCEDGMVYTEIYY